MKKSYYLYNEWKWNNHLQLIKKSKNINLINKETKDYRKDKGVVLHIVKANHAFSAKGIIRAKDLNWNRNRLPKTWRGKYIRKITH